MAPKKVRNNAENGVPTWCWRALLLLGAAASIVTLVELSLFVWKVSVFAEEAPKMMGDSIMRYVESEAPELLDAYVEEKLMPGLQEQVLGWIFGPGAPTDGAAADEVTTHHSTHQRRRHAEAQCPVRDASLCAKFRETCSAFTACRTARDRPTCLGFVRKLNAACAANSCDTYYDRDLCNTVETACGMRIRCMFNQSSCMSMESDLASLCATV